MSNYRGHVVGSAIFAVAYMAVLGFVFAIDLIPGSRQIFNGFSFPIAIVGLAVLFGLWPDVDTNSKGQNIFYWTFFVLDITLILAENYRAAAYLGLLVMLPVLSKHRGWTHSKWAMLIVPLPFLILPRLANPGDPWVGLPYYGAAVTGYFSHLFFDGLIIKFRRKHR